MFHFDEIDGDAGGSARPSLRERRDRRGDPRHHRALPGSGPEHRRGGRVVVSYAGDGLFRESARAVSARSRPSAEEGKMPDIWTHHPEIVRDLLREAGFTCGVEPRILKGRDPDWTGASRTDRRHRRAAGQQTYQARGPPLRSQPVTGTGESRRWATAGSSAAITLFYMALGRPRHQACADQQRTWRHGLCGDYRCSAADAAVCSWRDSTLSCMYRVDTVRPLQDIRISAVDEGGTYDGRSARPSPA